MWTFRQVEDIYDEWVLRQVIFEVNNLMCGRGVDGSIPNRAGINDQIWERMMRRGGLSEEGIRKVFAGERMSQRDTIGPFDPFTYKSVHGISEGETPLLKPDEVDHVIQRILKFSGRLLEDGTVVKDNPDDSHSSE